MGRLEGKVAVITGGNSGIGECTAEMFAKEGAKVVISARRVSQLETVADKIRAAGGEVLVVPCDISKKEQCAEVVAKTVETFGKLDILVNNAGVVDSGIEPIEKVTDETIDSLIDINAKGTLYMAREAAKVMVEAKAGSIVNVSSVAGYTGGGGVAYVASKAAVIGMTKNIAMRCAMFLQACPLVHLGRIEFQIAVGGKAHLTDFFKIHQVLPQFFQAGKISIDVENLGETGPAGPQGRQVPARQSREVGPALAKIDLFLRKLVAINLVLSVDMHPQT